MRFVLLFFAIFAAIAAIWPVPDITVAGWFFDSATTTFPWRSDPAANFLHEFIQVGARVMAALLLAAVVVNRHRKAALFLLVALIVGPGLITNTVLKDNWDRARPLQVQEFGGAAAFTPAWQPTDQCDSNCSFVSGDGALGFFLHTFFYVVSPYWRRRVFAIGFIGGGAVFGGLRIIMGAHFLSDVLWAGLFMLASSAVLHGLFYGFKATRQIWRETIFKS
jgi:lipid A 4'-phosphatase